MSSTIDGLISDFKSIGSSITKASGIDSDTQDLLDSLKNSSIIKSANSQLTQLKDLFPETSKSVTELVNEKIDETITNYATRNGNERDETQTNLAQNLATASTAVTNFVKGNTNILLIAGAGLLIYLLYRGVK